MPFDINKYTLENEKESKINNEELIFNFCVFNNKGVISNGYYYYYILLWGFYIELLAIIPNFLFGESSLTSFCMLCLYIFFFYIYFNITCKRMTDIYGTYDYNKWLAVFYMIPIISFRPLFGQGKITPDMIKDGHFDLQGENNNFTILYGNIKTKMFWFNSLLLIIILCLFILFYSYIFTITEPEEINSINREIIFNSILWFIWFFANINKFRTYLKSTKPLQTPEQLIEFNNKIDYKKGFKRVLLALGYLLFILIGLAAGLETSFFASIIGAFIGFFAFKYLIIGFKWVIDGFKK